MELRNYQQKVVNEVPNKWGLWFRMRVGKTPTSIRLASTRIKKCLTIVPASIKNQWEEEIKKWNNSNCEFIVISKDKFRRNIDSLPIVDGIIIDEIHRAGGNYKSKFFKTLIKYIKNYNIKYVWGLTGTPLTSSSWSVYSYGKLFGKDWNWFEWRKHFFKQSSYIKIYNPRTRRKEGIWQPKENMEKDLEIILKKIGTVIDLKDIADIPDDYDVVETFSLNTDQKKRIKNITDFLPIVKNTKQHQIENGVKKGDEYIDDEIFTCNKDKRLKELVEDNKKIIIVVSYHAQINKYREMFKKYNLFEIHGKTKEKADAISKKAEKAKKAVVIVQADTCVGYSLKSFNTIIFASMSYSFVNYDQMRSRIKATDKKIPNTYIHFLTEGKSVDRGVYTSVKNKEDFNIKLFNNK